MSNDVTKMSEAELREIVETRPFLNRGVFYGSWTSSLVD